MKLGIITTFLIIVLFVPILSADDSIDWASAWFELSESEKTFYCMGYIYSLIHSGPYIYVGLAEYEISESDKASTVRRVATMLHNISGKMLAAGVDSLYADEEWMDVELAVVTHRALMNYSEPRIGIYNSDLPAKKNK